MRPMGTGPMNQVSGARYVILLRNVMNTFGWSCQVEGGGKAKEKTTAKEVVISNKQNDLIGRSPANLLENLCLSPQKTICFA